MRVLMGVMKDRHGTYYARQKVPKGLEEATARVLGNGKRRQTWLKKSLRTKSAKQANVLAKPVLIEFDATIARARATLEVRPKKSVVSKAESARIVEYHYSTVLGTDAAARREGRRVIDKWRRSEGLPPVESAPKFGLTDEEYQRRGVMIADELAEAQNALAKGKIEFIAPELDELLALAEIDLDENSSAYRLLATATLQAHVRALKALQQRQLGEPIETPQQPELVNPVEATGGGGLKAAFAGWKKARNPSAGALTEYERAIALFVELHGDVPVVAIKRSHARAYREALQDVPRRRTGKLLKAHLPELAQWGREHPDAPRLTNGTINKLMGGVQAVCRWAREQGVIPDDAAWSDPFASMRLDEDDPGREPFTMAELRVLFGSSIFTEHERPSGGRGDAAFWLPLLALFTGARQSELAALTVQNLIRDEDSGHLALTFVADADIGKSLKTASSARTVPLHPQLIRVGFEKYVEQLRGTGPRAWLFADVAPDCKGGRSAWSKWFMRHLRQIGITDRNKVFHSLRHNFKDALRAAKVPEDLNDALTGHSTRGSVSRSYGARDIVQRYGMATLADAVARIQYVNLDLSRVEAR